MCMWKLKKKKIIMLLLISTAIRLSLCWNEVETFKTEGTLTPKCIVESITDLKYSFAKTKDLLKH